MASSQRSGSTSCKVGGGLDARFTDDRLTLTRWHTVDGLPGELGDFDLTPEQAMRLVRIIERHKTRWGCKACRGRGIIQAFETGGDSSKGTGWANLKQTRCPECRGKGAQS